MKGHGSSKSSELNGAFCRHTDSVQNNANTTICSFFQIERNHVINAHSSSPLSSSASPAAAAAFLAGFFFLLLVLALTSLASGCLRISRISSSVIFLSDLSVDKSGVGGPASFWIPFLVMATYH